MKKISLWLLIISLIMVFSLAGCDTKEIKEAENQEVIDSINGTWQGQIIENYKSTLVQLVLRDKQDTVEGEFKVLGETGQDIDKGMSFKIIQTEYIGNKLKFVVPITGEVDDDALVFELLFDGGYLKGDLYELREGSVKIPVTFVRQVTSELGEETLDESKTLEGDKTPPKIYLVSIEPTVVKNGDTIYIVTKASEAELDVTIDISDLDSSKTKEIVLNNKAGGTYRGEVTISTENEIGNGIKKITVNAVDSSGNTSTAVVEVQLKNSYDILDEIPPDDNFNGTIIDTSKWRPDASGGGTVKQDGRLIFSTDSNQATSRIEVKSNWQFTGDFDVQVDFQISEGWGNPTRGHIGGASLGINIAGTRIEITRLRTGDTDKINVWRQDGPSGNSVGDKLLTSALSGKFRMVRIGTTLAFQYDIGEGWQEIASTTVAASPAQEVYMGISSMDAYMAFTTYFDNFKINSGVTTY